MKEKSAIEEQVDRCLKSIRNSSRVETPPFFAERTMRRMREQTNRNKRLGVGAILKIAAIIVLAVVNLYTIFYISGGSKQEMNGANSAAAKEFVKEYQPNDSTVVTIENNLNDE